MNENLIVRLYRVGFGDCIFIQIPDANDTFTILIDCGTSAAAVSTLKPIVQHIRSQLPEDQNGKPRLDLLVVTHPHADHMKGFDPAWFQDVTIGRIWMTAFMNLAHPQAQKALAFEQAAYTAAKSLYARSGLHLARGVHSLMERSLSLSNTGALSALRQGLPTTYPRLYVARDVADQLSDADINLHNLRMENGITSFRGFQDQGTCLRILAPEWDIDSTYLGKIPAAGVGFFDPLLPRTMAYGSHPENGEKDEVTDTGEYESAESAFSIPQPENISARDFRLLRNGLLNTALAFLQQDDDLKNNTSVVLLLEWHGRRLLFTSDAEWDGTGLRPGQHNCSWDVMLSNQDVKDVLLKPLDLFKVAHHGSHNGSPYDQQGGVQILPEIITPERTHVIVSTVVGVHGKKNPVPFAPLLKELGRLTANGQVYPECEAELKGLVQPRRTDLESDSSEAEVDYLEVTFEAKLE